MARQRRKRHIQNRKARQRRQTGASYRHGLKDAIGKFLPSQFFSRWPVAGSKWSPLRVFWVALLMVWSAEQSKEQGERPQVILSYRRGLATSADQPEALLNLGVLLAEDGQQEEAIGRWRRLLTLKPEHAQAQHNLGVALAQQRKNEEAIRELERALELKPDYAEACCNLANVLCNNRGQGPVATAVEHVRLFRNHPQIR
jgi:tetratricopeptide (TPR) repeat protein